MRGLLFCCAVLSVLSSVAHADGTRFVFVSEPQTIRTGEISGELKIQMQDTAGAEKKTDETVDLSFSSTSSTGVFLNAAGNTASTVMAKGTANRTFFYRDASSGTHILTVQAMGRVSGQSWTMSQRMSVVSDTGADAQSADLSQNSTASSIAPVIVSSRGSVTASALPPAIEAYAGRDRAVIAGADTAFEGTAVGLLKEPIQNARFWWNFGDGSTAEGRAVSHIFRVPGTYMTGLHVSSGIYAASDYSVVSVMSNKVAVTEVTGGKAGFVRLRNGSAVAVDIGGWAIEEGGGRQFLLPPHTMVTAGGEIALANAVTMLAGAVPITMHFPDGSPAFSYTAEPSAPEQTVAPVPVLSAIAAVVSEGAKEKPVPAPKKAEGKESEVVTEEYATATLPAIYAEPRASSSGQSFLLLAALLSGGASAGFLFLKKFFV